LTEPTRELTLEELPAPPLWRLVGDGGEEVRAEAEVGGEPAMVAALFGDEEVAREFSAGASGYGMEALKGLTPKAIPDWGDVEAFAEEAGEGYVLVVSRAGTGLFFAGDVARVASERAGEWAFPLFVISDETGEAPLVTVEADGEEEVAVAPLFGSPEAARTFRDGAPHLGLPGSLGRIEDPDGLRRHALVAREAGAQYAVLDPGPGPAEAIPLEDLIR